MLREVMGDDIDIGVDFHAKTSPAVAVQICREVGLNLMSVEEWAVGALAAPTHGLRTRRAFHRRGLSLHRRALVIQRPQPLRALLHPD